MSERELRLGLPGDERRHTVDVPEGMPVPWDLSTVHKVVGKGHPRVDARAKVRGIVHGTSQSGQTVFVEPEEIVELNNQLKLAELEVLEEERRILGELTALVADELPRLRANLEILAALDLIDAGARLSFDLRGSAPELVERESLDLRHARHPLMVLAGRNCVPNDIVVGASPASTARRIASTVSRSGSTSSVPACRQ